MPDELDRVEVLLGCLRTVIADAEVWDDWDSFNRLFPRPVELWELEAAIEGTVEAVVDNMERFS